MTVGRSLLLLCLAYAVPFTAIICYQIVIGVGANVRFAQQEKRGNAYLRPLVELLVTVPDAIREAGAPGQSGVPAERAAAIDQAWKDVAAVQAEHGVALDFTEAGLHQRERADIAPALVSERWSALRAELPRLTATEIAQGRDRLVSDLRRMISHAGDTSNLILDPDLDSYYLMDVTLLALPQTIDRLAQIETYARTALGGAETGGADPAHFAVLAAQLQEADVDRVVASSATGLLEDQNFYGVSPTLHERYAPALETYKLSSTAVVESLRRLSRGDGTVTAGELDRQIALARADAAALWRVGVDELDQLIDTRIAHYRHSEFVGFVLTLAALVLTSLIAWWFARRVRGPLSFIAEQLQSQAREISAAAHELTSTSHTVANGASEQAALVEETGGTLRDLAGRTRQSSSAAEEAATVTRTAGESTARSREAMQRMSSAIQQLEEQSTRISQIVETINGFAFRTNLLALNAAVEAARAGEAGASFTVVADEVRNLARRVNDASADIAELINRGLQFTREGSRSCQDVAAALDEVNDAVQKAASQVARIHEANADHERGMHSAEKAVEGIEEVTQANAAGAEETAAAAEELAAQSGELRRILRQLSSFAGNRVAELDDETTAELADLHATSRERSPVADLPMAG